MEGEDYMEQPLEPKNLAVNECDRCLCELTGEEIRLASEDTLHYCMLCREAVEGLRIAIRNVKGGKFRAGI